MGIWCVASLKFRVEPFLIWAHNKLYWREEDVAGIKEAALFHSLIGFLNQHFCRLCPCPHLLLLLLLVLVPGFVLVPFRLGWSLTIISVTFIIVSAVSIASRQPSGLSAMRWPWSSLLQ